MKTPRYTNNRPSLPKESAREICPSCGQKSYKTYRVNGGQGKELDPTCGRCNRENNCGYHLPPRDLPLSKRDLSFMSYTVKAKPVPPLTILPANVLNEGISRVLETNLAKFLLSIFDEDHVKATLKEYKCGLSRKWSGAIAFPQLDSEARLRQVKCMPYGIDGHRIKNLGAQYVGKAIAISNSINAEGLRLCFFGEHLLSEFPNMTVAIVESEKTALTCSIAAKTGLLPKAIYLATGGDKGCKWNDRAVFSVLYNRNVRLYPDDDKAGRKWDELAVKVKGIAASLEISHIIAECGFVGKKANTGQDLADLIIASQRQSYDWPIGYDEHFAIGIENAKKLDQIAKVIPENELLPLIEDNTVLQELLKSNPSPENVVFGESDSLTDKIGSASKTQVNSDSRPQKEPLPLYFMALIENLHDSGQIEKALTKIQECSKYWLIPTEIALAA